MIKYKTDTSSHDISYASSYHLKSLFDKFLIMAGIIAAIQFMIPFPAEAAPIHVIAKIIRGDTLDNFGNMIEPAGDFNGDGYHDIWVDQNYDSDPISGKDKIYLYFGGNPMDTVPDMIFKNLAIPIYSIVNIGDINNDGYDDFIFNYGGSIKSRGLHYGGPLFKATPDLVFPVYFQQLDSYGYRSEICGGRDMDGDGKPDLVLGEPASVLDQCGKVYFYSSYPQFDTIADAVFSFNGHYPQYSQYGFSVAYLDSLDGNGFLAINLHANSQYDSLGGRVFLYKTLYGTGWHPVDTTPDYIIASPSGTIIDYLGRLLRNIGDMNGDGFTDVVIGDITSQVYNWIYFGGAPFDTVPDLVIQPTFEQLEGIGDVNNDGFPDFIVGEQPFLGRATIYYGGQNMDGYADKNVGVPPGTTHFGLSVVGLGDMNGDSIDDFAVTGMVDDYGYWPGVVYIYAGYDGEPTAIEQIDHDPLPEKLTLGQNYPNPFNPSTTIEFELSTKEEISIDIFDISGRKIKSLLDRVLFLPGKQSINWDGKLQNGAQAASGVYFYTLKCASRQLSKKMILVK